MNKVHLKFGPALMAVGLLLAACGSASSSSSTATSKASTNSAATSSSEPLVYVVGYIANNPFWNAEGKGAQEAGKLFHVNVRYEAPATAGTSGMTNIIHAALGAHPAGIAIDYTGKSMEKPVLAAINSGVKVVLYNNNRFGPANGGQTKNPLVTNLGFSGQNEHLSGAKLATAFLKYLPPGGGTVLVGNAFPQASVLTLRYHGVSQVLSAHGYKTALLNLTANEANDQTVIGSYLAAHPKTVGFIGLSGDIETNAAAQYISSQHLNIPLATFDIDPHTVALMKSVKTYDVALDQQPYLQGFYAVANLAMQLKYGFAPIQMNTGSLIVTKSNLAAATKLVAKGVD